MMLLLLLLLLLSMLLLHLQWQRQWWKVRLLWPLQCWQHLWLPCLHHERLRGRLSGRCRRQRLLW